MPLKRIKIAKTASSSRKERAKSTTTSTEFASNVLDNFGSQEMSKTSNQTKTAPKMKFALIALSQTPILSTIKKPRRSYSASFALEKKKKRMKLKKCQKLESYQPDSIKEETLQTLKNTAKNSVENIAAQASVSPHCSIHEDDISIDSEDFDANHKDWIKVPSVVGGSVPKLIQFLKDANLIK